MGTGGGGGAGRRWYTLVPVSPLIKSSLKQPESENTQIHASSSHTHTLTRVRTHTHTYTDVLAAASDELI